MKNIKVVLKILIIFAALAIPLHSIVMVRADSGWDSDYGGSSFGGSSWSSSSSSWGSSSSSWSSSSSSWSSSNTWSSSSSKSHSGSSDPLASFIGIMLIVVAVCLYSYFTYKSLIGEEAERRRRREEKMNYYESFNSIPTYNQTALYEDVSEEILQKYLPGETLDSLKNKLFDIYKEVQIAWMNFDYDKLKELCANDLATTYIGQLEMLKVKKGQNIMNDWSLEGAKITKIVEASDFVYVTGIFDTRFYDYVINTENGLVTRGYKQIKVHNIYEMLFVVNKKIATGSYKCPKCGAVIKPNKDGKCEYCHTALSFANSKITLSRKSRIN